MTLQKSNGKTEENEELQGLKNNTDNEISLSKVGKNRERNSITLKMDSSSLQRF